MPEIRPIGGACVWHGHDMAKSKRWQRQLSPLQLAEIDAALRGARARGLRWEAMTAADFPLPSFAPLADHPASAVSHRPLRCRRAVLYPPGEIGGPEPIVQLARRAQRDAAAPAGALRRALRAGVAQPLWRRGRDRRFLLPAAGLGRAR